jgi:hypothetical protein
MPLLGLRALGTGIPDVWGARPLPTSKENGRAGNARGHRAGTLSLAYLLVATLPAPSQMHMLATADRHAGYDCPVRLITPSLKLSVIGSALGLAIRPLLPAHLW